jgi:hypothetical protein
LRACKYGEKGKSGDGVRLPPLMLVDLGLADFYHPGRAYNEIVALHSTMYHRPLASKRRMIPELRFCLSSMVIPISQSRYRDDGGGCMAAAD